MTIYEILFIALAFVIIFGLLNEILDLLKKIWAKLAPAVSATLTFKGVSMPATIDVGKTATAVFTEFDGPNGTGNKVAPKGTVTFSSSDPTVATVDASTGIATGVAAGTVSITGSDSGNGLTASDSLAVNAVAQSATLVLTAN